MAYGRYPRGVEIRFGSLTLAAVLFSFLFLMQPVQAQTTPSQTGSGESLWLQPSEQILQVLHAPELPWAWMSPAGDVLALAKPVRYPPISDLARPMLRLAGVRIDAASNARHGQMYASEHAILRVADGGRQPLALPPGARVTDLRWSADGRRVALLNEAEDRVELWIADVSTGAVLAVPDLALNPVLYSECTWMPDQKRLLVKSIPAGRGLPPEKPLTPAGPRIQESAGGSATSTYEARDVLTSPFDEGLFEYYATSQLALVDAETGRVTPLGQPDVYARVVPSPDGQMILVQRVKKPWSYSTSWYRFPRDVEVWTTEGRLLKVVASLPPQERVPIHGVPEGPRDHVWRPTREATLVWIEALDGGDPGRKAAHRDRILMQSAPFEEAPREIYRAVHRVSGLYWGEREGLFVEEWERERRWQYFKVVDPDSIGAEPRLLFDLSANDRYGDPGSPVQRMLPNGHWVAAQEGGDLFLSGSGSTPRGDRPFLDRYSLTDLRSERLFRSDSTGFEQFVGFVDFGRKIFVTREESPLDPPNFVVRTLGPARDETALAGEAQWASQERRLTAFEDPTPQIRSITRKLVTYQRADGTPLSFTLFLPPGYTEGTRLPTVIDAYPLEYSDPGTAGQISGSDRQFTRFLSFSTLFFLLDGYAVLSGVTMPVIGDPDTAYDTFIEQLVSSAEAAVAKASEMGVTDPERVGVLGHSHGALMTATLLAHSDLFRAGIARSGAYNHTMRPFGFQGERRTFFQARDTYIRLSPALQADRINEPILLIHGEVDENPGTVPLQSEKLFEAVRGTGGTARLVMLPHEGHGYEARESVEHVLAEQLAWFDRYVKKAGPRIKS